MNGWNLIYANAPVLLLDRSRLRIRIARCVVSYLRHDAVPYIMNPQVLLPFYRGYDDILSRPNVWKST